MTIGVAGRATDYVALAKPRLNLLVVVSTVAGYAMAHGDTSNVGRPALDDRRNRPGRRRRVCLQPGDRAETDSLMRRTRLRPLPDGRLASAEGAGLRHVLVVRRAADPCRGRNVLAARSPWRRSLSYAVVYTPLKRRTSFATVIGAIPGALPPVIGWAAAENALPRAPGCFRHPLPVAAAAFPGHRLDVSRGLRPRRPANAAGDRAGWPQHGAPGGALRGGVAPGGARADVRGDVGPGVFRGRAGPDLLFLGMSLRFAMTRAVRDARRLFFASISYLPLLWALMIVDRT